MYEDAVSNMGTESPKTDTFSCPQGRCSPQSTTLAWNHSLGGLDQNLSWAENVSYGNSSGFPPDSKNLLSDEAQTSLIVLYSFTIFFSIVGNILVVVVFTKGRRSRTDIRPFLINLAIADLIMALFCMPFTFTFVMIRTWIFSKPMCPIVLFMQHLSVSASVFTNMAIGIDRFLVVTFPLRARMTSKRTKYTICFIWIAAVALSSVQLVVGRATDYGEIIDCDEVWGSPEARRTFTMFVLFITYIIPLVILSVTYSIVCILLWKRTAPGNAHEDRDLQHLRAKRKVIKMLVLVVIMFGVCWLPLHTFFLVFDFNPHLLQQTTEAQERLVTVIFYTVFWLAMSNSCANPIIYGFTNDSFRTDLASLFLKKFTNRQLSFSTYDSAYNKRYNSTAKKTNVNSVYRQSACRNGSKVYIELQRDMSRGRSLASMNDFYRESLSKEKRTYMNGSLGYSYSHNRHRRHHNHHHHHHNHRQLQPLFRTDSGESTASLTSPNNHEYDRVSGKTSANGCDNGRGPVSPTSILTREFSFTNSGSSSRLNPLPEGDSDEMADFNTV